MSLNYKAENLARVLNEAQKAKPIEGMDNTYDPENYSKLYAANKAIAEIESSEYLVPQIEEGAFEWDKANGRPKSIGRYRPAMLDLNVLTTNVYQKSSRGRTVKVDVEEEVKDTDGKKAKRKVKKDKTVMDTVIKVIFGRATVQAIRDMKEIGNAVKAQVFVKREGEDWTYEGNELIQKEDAYKFKDTLNVPSALKLMRLVESDAINDKVEGDSLDDVA